MADEYAWLKIAEFTFWELYLHENQYYPGRVYLWAKEEGDRTFLQMTAREQNEFLHIAPQIRDAITAVFDPDRMNYAAFGNEAQHLHIHFIPRYQTPRVFHGIEFVDANWGRNYAPYDRDFSIPEDVMTDICDDLKNVL